MKKSMFDLAEECLAHAKDFSGQLLMYSCVSQGAWQESEQQAAVPWLRWLLCDAHRFCAGSLSDRLVIALSQQFRHRLTHRAISVYPTCPYITVLFSHGLNASPRHSVSSSDCLTCLPNSLVQLSHLSHLSHLSDCHVLLVVLAGRRAKPTRWPLWRSLPRKLGRTTLRSSRCCC